MLETAYSIIGAFVIGSVGILCLVLAISRIMLIRKIRIIRMGMESCYRAGYSDAKEGKECNPPKHVRIEYPSE